MFRRHITAKKTKNHEKSQIYLYQKIHIPFSTTKINTNRTMSNSLVKCVNDTIS